MSCKTSLVLAASLVIAGCSGEIYLRDGVTDGDTFYLAQRAMTDDDPVFQSWVRYSLSRSTCQLGIGGENPARASSFDCELAAREMLLEAWFEARLEDPSATDRYLDELLEVERAGYLREYVARNHARPHWQMPDDLDLRAFRRWAERTIPGHESETRLTGSWNYARNVSGY